MRLNAGTQPQLYLQYFLLISSSRVSKKGGRSQINEGRSIDMIQVVLSDNEFKSF